MAEGEAPYRQVVENALEGVWVIDTENRTTYVNRRMAGMLGHTIDEMLGSSILDYRKAGDLEQTQKSVESRRSGVAESKESEILRKDGTYLPVLVATNPLTGSDGKYLGAVALVTDISELKQAQDALRHARDDLEGRVQEQTRELKRALKAARDSETRWKALVQSAPDVIATIGRDGTILFINRVTPPDTPDTVIGQNVYDRLPPEEHARLKEVLEKVFERGEPQIYESPFPGTRETPRTYENRVRPLKIDGNADAALFISTDITDRKIAEDALRASEERFRTAFEQGPMGMAITDMKGRFLGANAMFNSIIGYDPDELAGLTYRDFTHPDNLAQDIDGIAKLDAGDIPFYRTEKRYLRKDGREVWCRTGVSLLHDAEGKAVHHFVMLEDITDYKLLEADIRESEQEQSAIVENASEGILLTAPDGRIYSANPAACCMFGRTEEELIRLGRSAVVDASDPRLGTALAERARTGSFSGELTGLRRDGTRFPMQVSSSIYKNARGEDRSVMIISDLTARRTSERVRTEKRELLEKTFSGIQDAIFVVDPASGTILQTNKAADTIFGYGPGALVGENSGLLHVDGSMHGKFNGMLLAALERKGVLCTEFPMKRKDGAVIETDNTVTRVLDDSGHAIADVCVIRDITERKRAESARKDQSEILEAIFEKSVIGIALVDLNGRIIRSNRATREFAGVSAEEMNPMSCFSIDHPDDLEKDRATFRELRDGKRESSVIEKRMIHKNGSIRWGRITRSVLRDGEGRPRHILSLIEDITGRKKAELAMRRALMRFELDEGRLYLVKEQSPQLALEAFRDLLRAGYEGYLITRTPGKGPAILAEHPFTLLWLSARAREGSIAPDLETIESWAEGLAPGRAILLEGLDHLVMRHGFNKTMLAVHRFKELAFLNNHIILLTVDPATLDNRQVRLLEKEGLEVRPVVQESLSEDLLETLRHIYDRNIIGVRPTHAAVGRDLKLSKPTVRKRLHELLDRGFVITHARGSGKTLELTEKGRMLFLR